MKWVMWCDAFVRLIYHGNKKGMGTTEKGTKDFTHIKIHLTSSYLDKWNLQRQWNPILTTRLVELKMFSLLSES